ncbi:MAG: hypothetical protein E6Q88_11660 [Lysobacteraceae bacterium]|nr:MAG: hypothetical protein E6Q88_11660 [Xanthomonadaceae bacterium]
MAAEGIVLEAMEGDREMIQQLAGIGELLMEKISHAASGDDSFYADYFLAAFSEIRRGIEPNKAFGWTTEREQHKVHHGETWDRIKKAREVAVCIEYFSQNMIGASYEKSVEWAADVLKKSRDDCKKIMVSVAPDKAKLSKSDAHELALDIVSIYGASGYQVARETAESYHKEYKSTRGRRK